MSTLKAIAAAALTAIVLAGTGGAIPAGPAPATYWRGWAIQGDQPYFQIWNPGPAKLCVNSVTVTSSVSSGAVFLLMDKPLPTDISDFGASWPEGIDLAGTPSDDRLVRSQGQLRASVGEVQLGAQIHNFTLAAHRPYRLPVNDCLGAGKGLTIRFAHPAAARPWVKIGARWSE